ncbi:MAG: UDP-3-O-(3-hydroxymyristoyl)glucosamine N-acyltransferase [Candidatus Margulisiibacteriota bacterium]
MKLARLAELVSGTVNGNADQEINKVSTIEEAGVGDLVFVLEDKNLIPAFSSSASAVVATKAPANTQGKAYLQVKNPRLAMAKILSGFIAPSQPGTISDKAAIAKSAQLGKNVSVGHFSCIGEDCQIGENTIIHSNVTIYDRVVIGANVIIHAGARIGVDGFGFSWENEQHVKIPQVGTVIIEDNVEIYANVCVARGTIGATRIGRGTKIDCLTHIAHNCRIGESCAITALVGFAGSVTFGRHVQVGGMSGFNGHITVGDNTIVMARSGVTKDIPADSVVSGFPAYDNKEQLKFQATLKRLTKKSGK